tara:strand:+ start:872 stop:1057 length:186 start_codon:yes stop_codon:yes gene_type:complete
MEYRIIQNRKYKLFVDGVNKYLEKGWELYGEPHYPVCFTRVDNEKSCIGEQGFWGQALIKK